MQCFPSRCMASRMCRHAPFGARVVSKRIMDKKTGPMTDRSASPSQEGESAESRRQRLDEAQDRLRAAQSTFLSASTTRIKSPLVRLQGYARMLDELSKDGTLAPDQARALIKRIALGTDELRRAVESSLDSAAVEANSIDLDLQPLSPSEPLTVALQDLRSLIVRRGAVIRISGMDSLPSILGDPRQLRKAWADTIGHALVYTVPGGWIRVVGQVLDIESEADEPGGAHSIIQINITGSPLAGRQDAASPSSELPEPSVDRGLAVAKGIVEAHGGRLWVENGHNEGSAESICLHLLFPMAPDDAAASR